MKGNPINPEHYNRLSPEPKDVIRRWGLNFNLGNAIKYVARAGHKGDAVEDLKKAQQYIQFEIDALEAEDKEQKPPIHPNCKCAISPVITWVENSEGVLCNVFRVEIPVGGELDVLIPQVIDGIKKIYGEQRFKRCRL